MSQVIEVHTTGTLRIHRAADGMLLCCVDRSALQLRSLIAARIRDDGQTAVADRIDNEIKGDRAALVHKKAAGR